MAAKPLEMDSSYQVMKLPGEEDVEYVLSIPYTPINKNNMVAFLVAVMMVTNTGR